MEYKIYLTEHARNDLNEIYEYIAFKLISTENAANTANGIITAAKNLRLFPERNPFYDEEPWKSLGVRFTCYKNYIIFYVINADEHTVCVSRIMYKGRDISNQLNENDFI